MLLYFFLGKLVAVLNLINRTVNKSSQLDSPQLDLLTWMLIKPNFQFFFKGPVHLEWIKALAMIKFTFYMSPSPGSRSKSVRSCN